MTVIGIGYIGFPTAILFAKYGYQVTGIDISPWVITQLNADFIHIEEPGLEQDLQEVFLTGNFFAITPTCFSLVF
ncbi:NAD-binding protein [Listeria grandensis]|uniref:NAD-binding protein n=1 Tax=Listeria grandensis TaxID=1494963 RepID=UPI003CC82EC9|nr:hypothetical protein [Listeria grandensis]